MGGGLNPLTSPLRTPMLVKNHTFSITSEFACVQKQTPCARANVREQGDGKRPGKVSHGECRTLPHDHAAFGGNMLGLSDGYNRKRTGKEEYLYSALYTLCISQSAQAWITQFYLQIHHACLSFVCVHQAAPPLTEVRDIQLQLTTHLSTPKR